MIYLDNAATTKCHPEVISAMLPYFEELYGNPSGAYSFSAKARHAVGIAREQVAALINAEPDEIYFTSGGTEADNICLRGVTSMLQRRMGNAPTLITDSIEHPAILNTAKDLEKKQRCRLELLGTDEFGFVSPCIVEKSMVRDNTLASIMFANNEIGTINDIAGISEVVHTYNGIFHTDAVQALGHVPVDVRKMDIDALSGSAHKIHGPKGVGVLYLKRSIKPDIVITGGGQENNVRSGTENVPAIVGFGVAAEIARKRMDSEIIRIRALRNRMLSQIVNEIPDCIVTGPKYTDDLRLPGNASIAFKGIEGASLLIKLDIRGICASTGSACSASKSGPSHVLKGIGLQEEYINGSLRLSLSGYNTEEEIDRTVEVLKASVSELRSLTKGWN